MMPNPLETLMARGLVPEAWKDVATLLADMIEADGERAGDAAATAFKRAGLPTPADLIAARVSNIPLLESSYRGILETRLFRYRLAGRRQGSRILVDTQRHPEPRAAIEAVLGPLSVCEPIDELPPAEPPAPEPEADPWPGPDPEEVRLPPDDPPPPPVASTPCGEPPPEPPPAAPPAAPPDMSWQRPPKPPRPYPLSPLAPAWARRAMGYPINSSTAMKEMDRDIDDDERRRRAHASGARHPRRA